MSQSAAVAPKAPPTVPDQMRAVRLYSYGGPEVLQLVDVPTPSPRPGEVLVRVRAIAVNSWDVRWRSGHAPQVPGRPAPSLPFQLGREGTGEIVSLGRDVVDRSVGQRVVLLACPACGRCAYCDSGQGSLCIGIEMPGHTRFGSYAEYVSVPAEDVFVLPNDSSFLDLVPVLWAYGAAQHMVNLARIGVGDVVVVTAAASAMGVAGMQLARLAGARLVIGLSRSERKREAICAAGADVVLDQRDRGAVAEIRSLSGERQGADVILDNYGSEDLVQFAIAAAGLGGRIVLAATPATDPSTETVALPIGVAFMKHLAILGSRGSTRAEQRHVLDLALRGRISMPVAHTLPFEDIARAHQLQSAAQHVGKIILTV